MCRPCSRSTNTDHVHSLVRCWSQRSPWCSYAGRSLRGWASSDPGRLSRLLRRRRKGCPGVGSSCPHWRTGRGHRCPRHTLRESRIPPIIRLCFHVTYSVMNLHFKIILDSGDGVLWGIVKPYILSLPLDYLSGSIVTWLSYYYVSEITSSYFSEVNNIQLGDISFIWGKKCEGDSFLRFPPVDSGVFQIDRGLLLFRIIAISEIPVVSALIIVPIRVPIVVDIVALIVFLTDLCMDSEYTCEATKSELMSFHFMSNYIIFVRYDV